MRWEYRCVKFPFPDDFSLSLPFKQQYADLPAKHTELLNELGADGWEWMHAERDLFYFRREVQEPWTTPDPRDYFGISNQGDG